MKKKVALFLIMVMLINMIAWADDGLDTNTEGTILLVVGIVAIVACILVPLVFLAEAEAPDDGIKMASMQSDVSIPNTGFRSFLNFLQHVEIGQTQNNQFYVGLRLQF